MKQCHLTVSEEKHREVRIMGTKRCVTDKNVAEEAIELYMLKYRLTDFVRDIKRK